MTPPEFHGLIQHSFSLRLPKDRDPFAGAGIPQQIEKLFGLSAHGGARFKVQPVGEKVTDEDIAIVAHSPLVRADSTTVRPLKVSFSGAAGAIVNEPEPPPAFAWSRAGGVATDPFQNGPTFVFADLNTETGKVEPNDYLVERHQCEGEANPISRVLLEILAHKRSRLLALALADRIVSVMLPHAILTPPEAGEAHGEPCRPWFVQPLLSFIRNGQSRAGFRDSYALTLLLVPVTGAGCRERKMTAEEIDLMVNAGWGLGAIPTRTPPPEFEVSGPLTEYLPRLAARSDPAKLLWPESSGRQAKAPERLLTLRQGTEVLAYSLARTLIEAPRRSVDNAAARRIGDDVVTALGSARVSSVLAVDDQLTVDDVCAEDPSRLLRHQDLMARIARETRRPASPPGFRRWELDRALVDDATYVVGVVPTKRCLVVSCAATAQHGWYQSGLMQAGSITHMTIGAASAIGSLCAIDRDLEEMEGTDPRKVTTIDGEIAADLRELYDLDITSESYRRLYRRLRKRLGITRDYRALEEKMMALYRATSTDYEIAAERSLGKMTLGIFLLTFVLIVLTVALIVIEANR